MSKETAFISFRSPSYAELLQHNCILIDGGNCVYGNKAFSNCGFNDCTYKRAVNFAQKLAEKKEISNAYILPPQLILPPNTLLMPIDYMELLLTMYEDTIKSQYFMRFCINERGDSFWTLLERELWRRHRSDKNETPYEYNVKIEQDQYKIEQNELQTMDKNGISVYTRIKTYIKPEPLSAGHFWGRYARACYIVQCQHCGLIFGLSKEAFSILNKIEKGLYCPGCSESTFVFKVVNDKAKRWTHRFDYSGERIITDPITPDYMIDILLDNNKPIPKNLPFLFVEGERFPSDSEITWDVILPPVGITKALYHAVANKTKANKKLCFRYYENGQIRGWDYEL